MRITESKKITDFFGCNVFNDGVMQKYMPRETYNELKEVTHLGKPLNKELANKVAKAMKEWAGDMGATHYTHWFQPLTGTTAEKHDSFISIDKSGNTVLEFTGSNLRKGEADASSFPSGGIRATFEARGYTVWDCSSPAFIKKSRNGAGILCIPTAFCSYTGEALDKKTPLLRSMEAINREGVRLLKILGVDAERVTANVGGEQEYFLIDKRDYNRRDDLKFTGRTLFGAMPPKGQEKNDQYYATIKDRVSDFMAELNEELWKLGITAKTQHNEVAPAQHELAPIFCTANIATDQNQLIMETLKKVADNHGLTCLLHEKPFAGVNGSGKHNNWSLCTDKGLNLLKPGANPSQNYPFLLFFTAVLAALDEYFDLVRMSAATLGNESRLGGHEAPPTVISAFIGEDMQQLFDALLSHSATGAHEKQRLNTGLNFVADIGKDFSDRNRTSPFAFTGNKFEFRMVGSSATLSTPNVVLNAAVSEMLSRMSDRLEKADKSRLHEEALGLACEFYERHKRIVFNGNGYSKEWFEEAEKRGLVHIDNSITAYDALLAPKNVALFEKFKIMNKKELESRRAIYLDNYEKTALIEARTMLMMAKREILPACMEWEDKLARDIEKLDAAGTNFGGVQKIQLAKTDALVNELFSDIEKLEAQIQEMQDLESSYDRCVFFRDRIKDTMDALRAAADSLETIVSRKVWPIPTYADILFYE